MKKQTVTFTDEQIEILCRDIEDLQEQFFLGKDTNELALFFAMIENMFDLHLPWYKDNRESLVKAVKKYFKTETVINGIKQ